MYSVLEFWIKLVINHIQDVLPLISICLGLKQSMHIHTCQLSWDQNYTFLIIFYCYSLIVVPIFPPLPSSGHPITHFCSQFPHCCPCPWAIHTCCLTSPFPFFAPLSPSLLHSGHCQSVPCFHVCGSILFVSLFCSLDSSYRWDKFSKGKTGRQNSRKATYWRIEQILVSSIILFHCTSATIWTHSQAFGRYFKPLLTQENLILANEYHVISPIREI